ncbi:hypothetical protein DY000_02063354 [Brassica cretica]|uniref:Adaptor protein ClpS core domain-containing protein n=1 Tax=Brassica cretica TaxID=69181 RepID=A0ABQ7B4C3_BRACR|nr:hypothetical protein DY000_02063354 [Brassica cretica]
MTTITTLNGRITGPISRSLLTWLLPPRSSSTTSANSTNATWKSKKMDPSYTVILDNDKFNKREYVVQVLMKIIPGMPVEKTQ